MSYRIAVVGATGNVGRQMLAILSERNFPVKEVIALASSRSRGKKISFGDHKTLEVQDLDTYDFTGIDIALFSAGAQVSASHSPRAAAAGCFVIDNSSHFRMHKDVLLVVPEVNGSVLRTLKRKGGIIANPNCSTIQMVLALKPFMEVATLKRVVVSTYQSVSGAGLAAMQELENQTKALYTNQQVEKKCFDKQIAFNIIPFIDTVQKDGFTKEEEKMRNETKKILDPSIEVVATCVRVPVFIGHSLSLNIELSTPLTLSQAKKALAHMPGIALSPRDELMTTPLEIAYEDDVYVSRLRVDPTVPSGFCMWVVADNLRKGAALNAVQIAEYLVKYILADTPLKA